MSSVVAPLQFESALAHEPHHSLSEWRALRAALGDAYRLLEPIAAGGMATVYLARERVLERLVAIKVLQLETAQPDDLARFRREARVLAALDHPGIVSVHAYGQSHGLAWFAMDFVEGGTLAARLARGVPMSTKEAISIVTQLALALGAAHRAGVVHGDLKPENVLCAGDGRVVLADFGVATVRTSDHSRSEIVKRRGTPHYMSPEQIAGQDLDGRSDIYALGVLAYRLLSGTTPFAGDAVSIAAQHIAAEPPPLPRAVPRHIAAIVGRCLEKQPHARWRHVYDVAAALASRRSSWRVQLAGVLRRLTA